MSEVAMRRRNWTKEEDAQLKMGIDQLGEGADLNAAWPIISKQVGGGRTSKVSLSECHF